MEDNVPNLNADELSAYASAKHLAGVPGDEIQWSIVRMLENDGWKEAAIAPMISEIARRTKGVTETKGSPKSPPKAAQDSTAAMMAALTQLTQMMAPITTRLAALEQRESQPPAQPQTSGSPSAAAVTPVYGNEPKDEISSPRVVQRRQSQIRCLPIQDEGEAIQRLQWRV
ncbi:hypothetical protein AA0116_g9181 [Alternaria tenuissima]|nr:hypothetical protein AA0116_g9181 [Alternaria tenuissima]